MAKARKMPTLGRGLSALLEEKTSSAVFSEMQELKEEIKKIEADRDRLLSLVEKLTEALINKSK